LKRADGRHCTEIDYDAIQIVPGSDRFIDHIVGKTAREALEAYQKARGEK